MDDPKKIKCPECGSENISQSYTYSEEHGQEWESSECKDCGYMVN